jgi:Helix-turn-helix domain
VPDRGSSGSPPTVDLGAFLANPTLADQLDLDTLDTVPIQQVPELIGALEAAKAKLWARLAGVERRGDGKARDRGADDDELLDDQAVSQLLHVPASHVADLRRRRELPEVRVGGKYVRVRRGDLREFVWRQRAPLP